MQGGGSGTIDVSETLGGLAFLERYSKAEFRDAIRVARLACEAAYEQKKLDVLRTVPADDLELSVRSLAGIAKLGLKSVGVRGIRSANPGCCYQRAGWEFERDSKGRRAVRGGKMFLWAPERGLRAADGSALEFQHAV